MARQPPVVVECSPRTDGCLSVVRVSEHECTLSTGEVLFIRYEKLRALVEQICQEQAAIHPPRVWWTKDAGNELIWCHRVGENATEPTTATRLGASDVF